MRYPCGSEVLSCRNRDTRKCSDARYAMEHWGGCCSFYWFDEDVYNNNLGKTEDDFEYDEE